MSYQITLPVVYVGDDEYQPWTHPRRFWLKSAAVHMAKCWQHSDATIEWSDDLPNDLDYHLVTYLPYLLEDL